MAASPSTTRQASKSYRRQALLWLLMTLVLGVVTALIWMFSQTPAIGSKIENAPLTAPQVLNTELKQPLSVEALHELDNDVQPISFEDTVRDLRNYPDEFKDKRYLLANKGKWTVQVMNVAENQVIASYLEGREDRKKFSYFRYRDENNQLRYMLTYGIMNSPQEAIGAAKLVDFGLPANVRVLPEEINRYVGIIDNYERPDPIKDLSTRRSRSVRLQPTEREVPVRQEPEITEDDYSFNNGRSIRESADTSETLALNEERIVVTEEGTAPMSTDGNEGTQQTGNLPVVPTPKPPSTATGTTNSSENNRGNSNSNSAGNNNNKANANRANSTNNTNRTNRENQTSSSTAEQKSSAEASKNNEDSIKQLIEEQSN